MSLQHLRSSTANKRPAPASMSDGQLAINTNDGSPGLFFKDSNSGLIKVGPVHVGTTAPNVSPATGGTAGNSKGELWLDTTNSDYTLKTWDGSAWREIVVTSAMIKNGEIVNADVNTSAAIAGTKISPDFGSQNVVTTGTSTAASFIPSGSSVPTNGVYLPAANTVAISTNGSGKLSIDSSGNVDLTGAGLKITTGRSLAATVANSSVNIFGGDVTTNSGANIELYGGSHATLANLLILDAEEHRFRAADGSSERMRITSVGNVGIGTTSPSSALQVNGTVTATTFSGSLANSVTFNNGGAGNASGATYNNGAAQTISYNTIGAAAASHTHGNITNAGAIGSTANLPIITTTSGVLTAGSFGTVANTFCQGNDSRLSDTRNTTNLLTFSNAGSGAASGTTFNGSAAQTISYNTIGAAASNQTMNIGTTSVAINRASANLALTGISSLALPGSTSGTVTITPAATAGTYTLTLPNGAGSSGQVLSTNGSGTLSWVNDAVGFRNQVINGEMMVAQRGTSFVSPAANDYTLDRWQWLPVGAMVVTITQSTDAPNSTFLYSLKVDVTTADASLAAGDVAMVRQNVEGYLVRSLIGTTFTISFWVKSSKTGVHCVSLRNTGSDRSYVAEYTVNSANTWEFKTITVTGGLITAGTWDWTNGLGLRISFALASGTTFQTTANTWQTGNFIATANQVNVMDNTANDFFITGVQLEPGPSATPFERRPIGTELALCQRYYQTGSSRLAGYSQTTVANATNVFWKQTMRATPTLTYGSTSTVNVSVFDIRSASTDGAEWYAEVTSNGGFIWTGTYTASAEL